MIGYISDRDILLQALVADPMVTSLKNAEKIRDELLEAHTAYLPQYYLKK